MSLTSPAMAGGFLTTSAAWEAYIYREMDRYRFFLISFSNYGLSQGMEKAMAAHSSVLAWRIPGTGEPGGLPCMESHRVGHD